MSGKFSLEKGKRAEREVVNKLNPIIDMVIDECVSEGIDKTISLSRLRRNKNQSDIGGVDLFGIKTLAIEVKHQETLAISVWWNQCLRQAEIGQIPILLYKKNNIPWRVRLISDVDGINLTIDISIDDFYIWFYHHIKHLVLRGD